MADKKYRYISFLVDPELESALKATAIDLERSVSWIIKKALANYISANKPKTKTTRRRKPASR